MNVTKGSGTLTLSDEITIPAEGATSIDVFFALADPEAMVTNAVAMVTYIVK